jgi:hypothetical protein
MDHHTAMLNTALAMVEPECPYCGATKGLRYKHRGYGPVAPEVTCEACFTPRDDGPCFDDLPEVA